MNTRSTPRDVSQKSKKCVVETEELYSLEFYIYFKNYEAIKNFANLEVSRSTSTNYHQGLLEGSRDFIPECYRYLFLKNSRNLSLEGFLCPSYHPFLQLRGLCERMVLAISTNAKNEDLLHIVCYELQLLFTRQAVHCSLQPTVMTYVSTYDQA